MCNVQEREREIINSVEILKRCQNANPALINLFVHCLVNSPELI